MLVFLKWGPESSLSFKVLVHFTVRKFALICLLFFRLYLFVFSVSLWVQFVYQKLQNKHVCVTKQKKSSGVFWTRYINMFVGLFWLTEKIKYFNLEVWLIGEIKETEGVCAYFNVFVFLCCAVVMFDERKFIHDTSITIIINKSKCTAAFDFWPLKNPTSDELDWYYFHLKNCFCLFSLNKLLISVAGVLQLSYCRSVYHC